MNCLGSSGPFSAYAATASLGAPAPLFLAAKPFHPTTTPRYVPRPTAAVSSPGAAIPDAIVESVGVPEKAEVAQEEKVPTESASEPPPFTPEVWIELFKHNTTHATIPHLNRTLNITGKDDKVLFHF